MFDELFLKWFAVNLEHHHL